MKQLDEVYEVIDRIEATMRGAARHRFIYKFGKALLMPFLKHKFHYTFKPVTPVSTPYIVLCNHVTNADPMLAGLAFRDSMYFVASDHLFRMGFISKLLVFAVSPIARAKATTDTQTVRQIFGRLKEGHNICIFAEGFSTFSGVTGEIPGSIAKLAKKAGVTLITYRLRGGYLTFPRWALTVRKGRMTGELVHQYTPEDLRQMKDEEADRQIRQDLYVNAYEDQLASPVDYHGEPLAEQLENALYCCPHCRSFSELTSKDDLFSCTCGYGVRFTSFGYFETAPGSSASVVFKTVPEWFVWQKEVLRTTLKVMSDTKDEGSLFVDRGQELFQTVRIIRNIPLGIGILSLFLDRLVFTSDNSVDRVFYLRDILDMSIITRMTLIFSTTDHQSYEIHSNWPRNAVKYMDTYRLLKAGKTLL